MTRLCTDGAEMRDLLVFSAAYSNILVANTSPAPFASDYYYKISYLFGSDGGILSFTGLTECYLRARVQITSAVGGTTTVFPVFRTGGTIQAYLAITGANTFAAYRGTGTLLEDSAVAWLADQWYEFEVYYKMDDAPDGRFVLKVDGTQIINFTGDTEYSPATSFDNIQFNAFGADSGYVCIDDFALNDTDNSDGKNDNSWCGDGIIKRIYPSGSGTTNNFSNSGSTSGSSNYEYVDEIPPDANSTYVYVSGSVGGGILDQYTMSTFDGTGKTIGRIYTESRIMKTQVDTHTIKTGFQTSGSTPQVSGSRTIYLNYSRIVGDNAIINPATGLGWTEEDINDIEYVIETV